MSWFKNLVHKLDVSKPIKQAGRAIDRKVGGAEGWSKGLAVATPALAFIPAVGPALAAGTATAAGALKAKAMKDAKSHDKRATAAAIAASAEARGMPGVTKDTNNLNTTKPAYLLSTGGGAVAGFLVAGPVGAAIGAGGGFLLSKAKGSGLSTDGAAMIGAGANNGPNQVTRGPNDLPPAAPMVPFANVPPQPVADDASAPKVVMPAPRGGYNGEIGFDPNDIVTAKRPIPTGTVSPNVAATTGPASIPPMFIPTKTVTPPVKTMPLRTPYARYL